MAEMLLGPTIRSIRSVMINDSPWLFCGDIARMTGARDTQKIRQVIHPSRRDRCFIRVRLDDIQVPNGQNASYHTRSVYQLSEGNPERVLISLPGLFEYLFKSRSDYAQQFTDWAYDEMLPALFRDGYYRLDDGPLKELADQVVLLQAEVTVLRAMQEIGWDAPLSALVNSIDDETL